jgi:transcriptional regulator with GAF, ATPase, and Fis domain
MKQLKEVLFELSAKLISVPPSEIGREIENGLKLIGDYWDFDRITLTEFADDVQEVHITHSYTASGITQPPLKKIDESIPWIISRLRRGERILLSKLPDDLPHIAKTDRRYCIKENLKSGLALPVKIGPSTLGGLFLTTLHRQRKWDGESVNELYYLAEILASALERMRAAEQINELMKFEQLLSEISATYINLPRDQYEKVIKSDLGRVGRLLGADRCIFYSVARDGKQFRFDPAFIWWPEEDSEDIKVQDAYRERHPDFLGNFQYAFDQWTQGNVLVYHRMDELSDDTGRFKKTLAMFGVKSYLSVPISVAGVTVGAMVITTIRKYRVWPEDLVSRIRLIGEIFANGLMRKRNEEEIQLALSEIKQLNEQIEADYLYLSEEIELEHNYGDIVGQSQAMQRILVKVNQVAPTDAPVLLLGETGTGKGLIARSIHNASRHSDRPLVQVNCGALSPNLIESELFGHEKGAFSGAVTRRVGRFELAHGTTLFLDEIGELPLELQPTLLQVLQDGEFERVGGSRTIKTDVRVIAATNRDLEREVESGKFRRDLWYRLSVFPINVPPLRERLEDIPLFVSFFVDKYGKWIGKKFKRVPQKTIRALKSYHWPGNIRELENLIERAVITSREGHLQIEIPASTGFQVNHQLTLQQVERNHILTVLKDLKWKIEGRNGAAQYLDLKPSTLRFRMKKLKIKRPSNYRQR